MPHIKLETTSCVVENQDVVDILERLVRKLGEFQTVKAAWIKAYHALRSTWVMGEGHPQGFVHCEVTILTGRDDALKAAIADGMYEELLACFSASAESKEASITLELREMDAAIYRK